MPRGRRIEYVHSRVSKFNKEFALCSNPYKTDEYLFANSRSEILARINHFDNQWYIWYEKVCCRLKADSFSSAITTLEKEFS